MDPRDQGMDNLWTFIPPTTMYMQRMVGLGHYCPIVQHTHLSNGHKVTSSSWTQPFGKKKRQCVHVNWRNSSNLNPNPVPLNRFTACLAEHTLGPLSLGTVSLTCQTLYRDCRQGQKMETSRKKCSSPVNFTYYFFLRTAVVVVVNQGDTLGQVRSPQLRSSTPGPKPPWIHSLIVHLYF